MTLVWIGGSLDAEAFEYNRDTDLAAAESVFSRPGLVVHQFPLETYRQCGYSVHELAEDVAPPAALGAWLWDHYPVAARSGSSSAASGRSATARPCW